ncbi:MAG: hypothetical protein JXA81_15970 [Sedimentisphaerales bacterium]|nr:hypothetical protein [Sedimentisphaerales bacterium]
MDEHNEFNDKDQAQGRMGHINRALGLFICFFAVVVLISIFWTETGPGKITNLGAGLILAVVGLIMIAKSKSKSSSS